MVNSDLKGRSMYADLSPGSSPLPGSSLIYARALGPDYLLHSAFTIEESSSLYNWAEFFVVCAGSVRSETLFPDFVGKAVLEVEDV